MISSFITSRPVIIRFNNAKLGKFHILSFHNKTQGGWPLSLVTENFLIFLTKYAMEATLVI